mgnify:CR=1 FL=1
MNRRDSFRCVEVSKPCISMEKAANFLVSLLPERSDATLLHNLWCQPRPFFKTCGEAATTTL